MSTVTGTEPPAERRGLSADEADFLGQVLTANAEWSASIHNAALDGQERASNEWAGRYLRLVQRLDFVFEGLPYYERESELAERIRDIVGAQSFHPEHAADQIERYRERLESQKREKELVKL